jgi:hypothetical protein
MSCVFYDVVYLVRFFYLTYDIVGLHTISYAGHTSTVTTRMSYLSGSSLGLFRRRKRPGAPPLKRVNRDMGAAFPVIFAFSPVRRSLRLSQPGMILLVVHAGALRLVRWMTPRIMILALATVTVTWLNDVLYAI